jgi:hypothetical protein
VGFGSAAGATAVATINNVNPTSIVRGFFILPKLRFRSLLAFAAIQ